MIINAKNGKIYILLIYIEMFVAILSQASLFSRLCRKVQLEHELVGCLSVFLYNPKSPSIRRVLPKEAIATLSPRGEKMPT